MPETPEEKAAREALEAEARRKAEESEEESSEEEEELTVEQLKAKLAEKDRIIKERNRENAERRKKLEALEKAEEERKQAELTEVQKAEAKAKAAEEEKTRLEAENKTLKLQRAFEDKVRDAKLEFKSSLAATDAFHALVALLDGEDEITDDHIKQLTQERDYLFGKSTESSQNNDARSKGKVNQRILTNELIDNKRKMIGRL
jgi:hypothetical protein